MSKADEITKLNSEIKTLFASPNAADKAKALDTQKLRNQVEELPDADASAEVAHIADVAEKAATKKMLEGLKIRKAGQEAVMAQEGIAGEVNGIMKRYERASFMEKLGLGTLFMLGTGAVATFGGGPLGLYLAQFGLSPFSLRRVFGSISTFYTMEAFVNKGAQKFFGEDNVPRLVKWAITAGSAATAVFAGPMLGEAVGKIFSGVASGVRDWAIDWGFFTPEKTPRLDKWLTPSLLPDTSPPEFPYGKPETGWPEAKNQKQGWSFGDIWPNSGPEVDPPGNFNTDGIPPQMSPRADLPEIPRGDPRYPAVTPPHGPDAPDQRTIV